ncbi:MAG: hypothetical protein PCFJNLEI_04088 [Verrucomicrobiae bacterium]|nr:hypothetical protein [Verrucomicrobiae bacterium]
MSEDFESGVVKYIQMRLSKLKIRELAHLSKIGKTIIGRWRNDASGITAKQLNLMSEALDCPFDVIVGRQPCLKNCPNCEQSRP